MQTSAGKFVSGDLEGEDDLDAVVVVIITDLYTVHMLSRYQNTTSSSRTPSLRCTILTRYYFEKKRQNTRRDPFVD